jgi:cellulose synthase/poly-beta-1,6-N-acetylglucosamine synthase-like glycosyltransferase
MIYFSIVVPTFGRPDEVSELLNSLKFQTFPDFEVILADGSPDDSVKTVADSFNGQLNLKHLHRKLLGISESRNLGVEQAGGEIIVFFDSDCVIPPQYLQTVKDYLTQNSLDAYGGPDRADNSFNNNQKAISYAMTSLFTTGGIRGDKKHVGKYQPRSFNMGIRKTIFDSLGGFSGLKVSEDIDLSMRLTKNGYQTGLIEDAYVYHKRRSTFYKFYRQVFSFGSGRIDLQMRHGDALKAVHMLPSLFVLFFLSCFLWLFISKPMLLLWCVALLLYFSAIVTDAALKNRSLTVGFLSAYASFVMLSGYGLGMIRAIFMRFVLKSRKESEKPEITKEA